MAASLFRHPKGRMPRRTHEFPILRRRNRLLPRPGGRRGPGLRTRVHLAPRPGAGRPRQAQVPLLRGTQQGHATLRREPLRADGILLHRKASRPPDRAGLRRNLLLQRHHRLPQGNPPQPPRAALQLRDRAGTSRPDPRRRLPVHPPPSTTPARRCTGSAASSPAAAPCCCAA